MVRQTFKTLIHGLQLNFPCLGFVVQYLEKTQAYTLSTGKKLLCETIMKVEGRLSYDISSPSDSWGWFQHLTRLLSYQSGAWRWDGDTPRNHSKLNGYLSTDNEKKNHSSALCRMRWGNGGCEEIKNMKKFNEYNY